MKKISVATPYAILIAATLLLISSAQVTAQSPHWGGGGSQWYIQSSITSRSTISNVTFTDALHGWATGSNGGLFFTTDGGHSWLIKSTGLTENLGAISFSDSLHGYVAGINTLMLTSDGGATWQQKTLPNLIAGAITNLAVGTATTLYVAVRGYGQVSELYGSKDSGTTWTNVTPSGANCYSDCTNLVQFDSATDGWFATSSSLYHTTDGANTWSLALNTNGDTITALSIPTGGVVKLSTYKSFYESSDNGSTWTNVGTSSTFLQLAFSSAAQGLGLDYSNGGAYATADGGATWQGLTMPPDPNSYYGNAVTPQVVGFRDAADPFVVASGSDGTQYFLAYGIPPAPTPTNTATSTTTPTPTNTWIPTNTALPTNTSWPTNTATASRTPVPSATFTAIPTARATATSGPGATQPTDTPVPLPPIAVVGDTPVPASDKPRPPTAGLSTTGQRRAALCHGTGLQAVVACVEASVLRIDVRVADGESEGTGFVVQSDNGGTYVLTNRHVVEGATAAQVRVLAPNGRTTYRVLGIVLNDAHDGSAGDLAVIRLAPSSLRPLAFSRSSSLAVGQTVASIGYGLAFQLAGAPSVTEGIVSALGRDLGDGFGALWIQHQSTINHGNSGGPLLDLGGHMVGVNTLSIDQLPGASGGNEPVQGIFFAIPASKAHDIAQRLIAQFRGPLVTTLKATQPRPSQLVTSLYRVTVPVGWISSRISRDRPYVTTRDGRVQVQFQSVTEAHRLTAARLRDLITRLARALGHTTTLTFAPTHINALQGLSGSAHYSNRSYGLSVVAVTDKAGTHLFVAGIVREPGATAKDVAQASAIVESLHPLHG